MPNLPTVRLGRLLISWDYISLSFTSLKLLDVYVICKSGLNMYTHFSAKFSGDTFTEYVLEMANIFSSPEDMKELAKILLKRRLGR